MHNVRTIFSHQGSPRMQLNEEEEEERDCLICLERLANQRIATAPVCNHQCCEQCLLRWMQRNPICPGCRAPIGSLIITEFYGGPEVTTRNFEDTPRLPPSLPPHLPPRDLNLNLNQDRNVSFWEIIQRGLCDKKDPSEGIEFYLIASIGFTFLGMYIHPIFIKASCGYQFLRSICYCLFQAPAYVDRQDFLVKRFLLCLSIFFVFWLVQNQMMKYNGYKLIKRRHF